MSAALLDGPVSADLVLRLKEASVVGLQPEMEAVAKDDSIPPDQMIWSVLQMHLDGAVAAVIRAPEHMQFDMACATAAFLGSEMRRVA